MAISMTSCKVLMTLALALFLSDFGLAQDATVFRGTPRIKINEGGVERFQQELERTEAANLQCVISKIGRQYFWASRENKLLRRTEAGLYVTYVAVDGSGYVRVLIANLKSVGAASEATETKFDYVEHLLVGLRSVTYYGLRR
jgi:hypothetical protein